MKKQINPTIKAHLLRSAFYLLLLLAVCAIPFALAQRNAAKRSLAKPVARADVVANMEDLPRATGPVTLPDAASGVVSVMPPAVRSGVIPCTPGWSPGGNFPSPGIRSVGVWFPANGKFYAMGGRSSDLAGSDFTHPFEYDPMTNTWTIKSATYADN